MCAQTRPPLPRGYGEPLDRDVATAQQENVFARFSSLDYRR
jgi:hypothetical protein